MMAISAIKMRMRVRMVVMFVASVRVAAVSVFMGCMPHRLVDEHRSFFNTP
jgi:hypothetical protein